MSSRYARLLLAPLAAALSVAWANADPNVLEFAARPINTRLGVSSAPAPFSLDAPSGPALRLVQFAGPVQQRWLDALSARGIVPVQYVASNGYLVWANEAAQLDALRASASWLTYAAPFYAFLKVDPDLAARLAADPASDEEVEVTVQVYVHRGSGTTKRFVAGKGLVPPSQRAPLGRGSVDYRWSPILKFENLDLRVRLSDVAAIAERADVTFVGLNRPPALMDEKQGLILSGDLAPGPTSPSYLQFLIDRGFSQNPADYPVVDVTDSVIHEGGTGATVLHTADPFLHEQGVLARPVRVAYFNNCSSLPDDQVGSYDGHGSLNAGIVAGYDQSAGYPYQDSDGQHLGLGINPFARVGSTVILVGNPAVYDVGRCGNSDQGVIASNWRAGARISSNSWGVPVPPSFYDSRDQAYDAGVRDTDAATPGNQEMIYVFAAANSGPNVGTVSSPGAAKNVITVGASQNLRPFATPSGSHCGAGSDTADDPQSIAGFSGRGPAPGNRTKPEIVAPGTHIQAAASVFSGYEGAGVCVRYYPNDPAQTIFTYSNGTSHSTPAVSGVASLAYWWIEHGGAGAGAGTPDEIGGSRAPSSALMKAWLIAHPTYLTGIDANDDLPSNSQGYGMPDMADMFDTTPKVLLDQSEVFDNTGEVRTYRFDPADPARPVRIALAYTDAPGAIGASPQVNDLDLSVDVGGQIYLGNHFDHQWSVVGGSPDARNNYEAVFMPAGTGGAMTVTVTATNIAGDGVPNHGDATDQDFALVCTNCVQAPRFDLALAESSLQVCSGAEQNGTLHVGSVAGFTDAVTLTATGNPADTAVTFAPNPLAAPGDATLTIAADADTAAGSYLLAVSGTSGPIVQTLGLNLNVLDAPDGAPLATAPADATIDAGTSPTLSWTAAPNASSYMLEVATDPGFGTIVQSLLGLTGTSAWVHDLAPATTYYWRVTAINPCGQTTSAVRSFTTANEICSTPGAAIPDDAAGGISDSITLDDPATLSGLRLRIRAMHTYVGDLKFTLSKGAANVVVIDRPGYTGAGYGCSGDDIDVLLDDAAATAAENQCNATPPAIAGVQRPNNAIDAAFANQPFAGTWTLTAADLASGETGALGAWCLVPQIDPASDTIFANGFESRP